MQYPPFFNDVQIIKIQDKLADFLGAYENGIIHFSYQDVVKLAGHSCPTVASAYLMTLKSLQALYKDEMPQRGEIKVEFKELAHQGVAGVIAKVVSQITGACTDDGFGGIANNFNRKNLLFFGQEIPSNMKMTRLDTGKSVQVYLNLSIVPPSQKQGVLMQKILSNMATQEEQKEFQSLWQERVKNILIDSFDDKRIVSIFEEDYSTIHRAV